MFENLYIKLLMLIVGIIDSSNKKKIIEFFKKHYKNKRINVLDIGTHKGETIDYLIKNFSIHQIYSCEPNLKLF